MLKKYLEYRFKTGLKRAYQAYFEEWLGGVTEEQFVYFEREMNNLIKQGKYDPEDKLIKEIANRLNSICDKIVTYKKVDATLSEQTLFETAIYLNMAESKLESGFVKDACNEVDELMKYN